MGMKFLWVEDDIAVTLRNKGGSYGGGSEVLVIEEKEDVVGVDLYNQTTTGGVSMTFGGSRTDQHNIPHVIVGGGMDTGRENGEHIHPLRTGKHPCTKRL